MTVTIEHEPLTDDANARSSVVKMAEDLVTQARSGDREAHNTVKGIIVAAMEMDRFQQLPLVMRAYAIALLARRSSS